MPKAKIKRNSWAKGLIGQEFLKVYQQRCCFWKVLFINTRQLKLWRVPKCS